jgi:hypothetical protein
MHWLKRSWQWWRSHPWYTLAALALFVLALRLGWGWIVAAQLRATFADIRARGHPLTLSDFSNPSVPNQENAWWWQSRAASALNEKIDSPRTSILDYPGYPPYPAQWSKLASNSEKAHQQSFHLARQARGHTRVQIHQQLSTSFAASSPIIHQASQLAQKLADGAEYVHLAGDDAEAFQRLLDVLHIARSVRYDQPAISQLVAIGIDATASHSAQVMATGLRRENVSPASPARASITQLIEALLDESALRPRLAASVDMERLSWIQTSRYLSSQNWMIRPLAERDLVRTLINFDIAQEAALCATAPEARKLLARSHWEDAGDLPDPLAAILQSMIGGQVPRRKNTIPRYSRWFYLYEGNISGIIERHFRVVAERRVTALALAAHLYRIDRGNFPARLSDLVPIYLPAIPSDPFRNDAAPMGYILLKRALPDGSDRPMLYYDAGRDAPPPPLPSYSWHRAPLPAVAPVGEVRQYRDLTLFQPASKKAVNNNPAESDDPGDDPDPDDDQQ